jgi:molybdopterin-guanine dinucleotide biosynthesis protein A
MIDPDSQKPAYSIAILMGGEGRRMGKVAKGLIRLGGVCLIDRILAETTRLGGDVYFVAKESERYKKWGVPVHRDIFEERASIVGIHTALSVSETDHVLVLAVDLPGVTGTFLEYLLSLRHEADLVVPSKNGLWEPLCAVYHRKVIKTVEKLIRNKRFKPIELMKEYSCREVTEIEMERFSSPQDMLTNLNTPSDIETWERTSRNRSKSQDDIEIGSGYNMADGKK